MMNEPIAFDLQQLLTDHDLLLVALEAPGFWSMLLADRLDGHEVTAVDVQSIGTGQVASCARIRLAHAAADAPRSVVVKTASSDPTSRATCALLRHGEIELGWYTEMASRCEVRTPQCYFSALSRDMDDFLLVLEDIEGGKPADQIMGMSHEQAGAAVEQLAALHATWWEKIPDRCGSWLTQRGDPAAHAVLLKMLFEGFDERYRDRLDQDVMDVARTLVDKAPHYLSDRPGPRAVVHGDFRPDNLLVATGAQKNHSVTVLDWQTVTIGPAITDVSYFVGGAFAEDHRRAEEHELLERYRRALGGRGVDLPRSELENGYRRYALDGLVMAIGASQVVQRTERGDEMFCAMAQRSAHHAMDAGTLELL